MERMLTEGIGESFYQHYPRIAAIVTASAGGKDNAMAAAWHMPVSFKPPLYCVSVSLKRYTYSLIARSKAFGINFLPSSKANLVAATGGSKGTEVDKFDVFDIAKEKETKLNVPILSDAYAAYECRLVDDRQYGDHHLLVGEIVATHWLKSAFLENGTLDISKVYPVLYMGNEQYMGISKCALNELDREACARELKEI